jgi:hypothetical protein
MQTHLLLNIYNDYSTLGLAINSVKDYVDTIIVADGAYQKYYEVFKQSQPDAKPWSTDGSVEILQAIPDIQGKLKFLECPREGWENQCVKRTALLDAVPEGDWFIVLDSDECLYGEVADGLRHIKASGCLAGATPMYTPGLDAGQFYPMWHPRVFLKLKGMNYDRKHWNLRDNVGRVLESHYPVQWTDFMVLVHLKVFRGGKRLSPHLSYMQMMSLDGWLEPMKRPQYFNIQDQ